jgi:hypothetical protein
VQVLQDPLLVELETVQRLLHNHNRTTTGDEQRRTRIEVARRMSALSRDGRMALAVDLLLDCDVVVPAEVLREMEFAASATLRLTRRPAGDPAWQGFHAAFCDRYGTSTLVPVVEVVDPDAGLGYPAGYPGSVLPLAAPGPSQRDARLLGLAWQSMAEGTGEITLTEHIIDSLAEDDGHDERLGPPHVELACRVYAPTITALDRGDFTLTVAPARAAGTLTARFSPLGDRRRSGAGVPLGSRWRRVGPTGADVVPAAICSRREHLPRPGLPDPYAIRGRTPQLRRDAHDHG